MARAMTLARAEAGRELHSTPVSRRGPMNRPQVLRDPRAAAPHRWAGPRGVDAIAFERLGADEVETAFGLAREQLEQRVLDRELTPGELGEALVAEQAHRDRVDVALCHRVPE